MFGFLRDMFEQLTRPVDEQAPAPVFVPTLLAPATYDPTVRVMAQAFVRDLVTISDVTFEDAWLHLYHFPIHSVPLLDSPAGWIALAQQMGLPPKLTVH